MREQYKVLSEKYLKVIIENDNLVFNPQIYDIYEKALKADSFEEFKALIKQLPDPWNYNVMTSGGSNSRAIVKDILKLNRAPSSFRPSTPADHFIAAVEHIADVEHSSNVTIDDIRTGYEIAKEHHAKWLAYKAAKEELYKDNPGVNIDI